MPSMRFSIRLVLVTYLITLLANFAARAFAGEAEIATFLEREILGPDLSQREIEDYLAARVPRLPAVWTLAWRISTSCASALLVASAAASRVSRPRRPRSRASSMRLAPIATARG